MTYVNKEHLGGVAVITLFPLAGHGACCLDMSEDQDPSADRNFRSAYYKSLGFRGSEKSVAHLEQLLKAEIFGENC